MVTSRDVVHMVQRLAGSGIPVWLAGGWGIDALLGEQTRPHKDLDVFIRLDDVAPMRALFERDGYSLKELWSENRWAADGQGNQVATAFVLRDAAGREIDVHALCLDEAGAGYPAWENSEGFVFQSADLNHPGRIDGFALPCLSPEMQIKVHTGYNLPQYQRLDLDRLREKFGVEPR